MPNKRKSKKSNKSHLKNKLKRNKKNFYITENEDLSDNNLSKKKFSFVSQK